jgi:hypothetical protein
MVGDLAIEVSRDPLEMEDIGQEADELESPPGQLFGAGEPRVLPVE